MRLSLDSKEESEDIGGTLKKQWVRGERDREQLSFSSRGSCLSRCFVIGGSMCI